MSLAFTKTSWWFWSRKSQDPNASSASSLNARPDSDLWESHIFRFPLLRGTNTSSSSRRVKKKWHSREERKIDREHDLVIVPPDGVCVSGSESDDSDYSIGWLEPHGPEFQGDDDLDNNFAVLVRCYSHNKNIAPRVSKRNKFGGVAAKTLDASIDERKLFTENWLSSLQNI